MIRKLRRRHQDADLDITSFMNLMIILVPVLLVMMVFSHITVLDLKLPDVSADPAQDNDKKKLFEVVINPDAIDVRYQITTPLKSIGKTEEGKFDYELLSLTLREIKRQLREDKGIERKDILILSRPDTDYQTLVSVMDAVRSFKAVVAGSVVDAELFPQISLGDAPVKAAGGK